ncbi:zinc finger BED domain-containing protein RICESLEEPER 2-like [Daucus carota subsp. sativus]|nr:PREDICTED: zinc finger BED domain-containing protein RICESLEEPER 2-like [Daucus carota subsp. sativus]
MNFLLGLLRGRVLRISCKLLNHLLSVAQKLQKAFELFESMDPYFASELNEANGVPTTWDWANVRRMVDILVHFYELTIRISGSLYVTSNIFYHEISTVNYLLKDWMKSDDIDVSLMGERMKEKYDKYWGDVHKMNKLIYVAVVVDPRYKLEFIEFALGEEYGKEVGWKLANDTSLVIRELFEEYKRTSQPQTTQTNQQGQPSSNTSSLHSTSSRASSLGARFMRQKMASGEVESKCELDIYLRESVFVTKNDDEFDILKWWKVNSSRFPILSQLARDVLAIPISTVASESAFSTGGRVLDCYRSSLTPKIVEGLICAQDWLRGAKRPKTIEEDINDLEKFEEVFSALSLKEFAQANTIDLDME